MGAMGVQQEQTLYCVQTVTNGVTGIVRGQKPKQSAGLGLSKVCEEK